jgi:hypothetical protein
LHAGVNSAGHGDLLGKGRGELVKRCAAQGRARRDNRKGASLRKKTRDAGRKPSARDELATETRQAGRSTAAMAREQEPGRRGYGRRARAPAEKLHARPWKKRRRKQGCGEALALALAERATWVFRRVLWSSFPARVLCS